MQFCKTESPPVITCNFSLVCKLVFVALSCPTLWDPMDCSLPGSSVHGILQARILQWIAIPFSRGSSRPLGIEPWVSCIAGRFFTIWATRATQHTTKDHIDLRLLTNPIGAILTKNLWQNLNLQGEGGLGSWNTPGTVGVPEKKLGIS